MHENKRTSNETSLGDAISKILKAYQLDTKLSEIQVLDSWEELFGKAVSARTEKLRISNRILYITLSSAVMREELMFAKEVIVLRINQKAGSKIIDDVFIS